MYGSFIRLTVYWKEGNNKIYQEPPDTGDLLTIPGYSKHRCGPAVRVGVYKGSGNRECFNTDLSQ
jgi:hypothetical protein